MADVAMVIEVTFVATAGEEPQVKYTEEQGAYISIIVLLYNMLCTR